MNDDRHFRMSLRNEEAETALMSGLLISEGARLPDILSADFQATMLWEERHQDIFEGMQQLYRAHSPINFVTLDAALEHQYTDYLLRLVGYDLASPIYVPHYANLVRTEWEKRETVDAASQLVADVSEGAIEVDKAIARLTAVKARSKGREMTAAEAIMSMKAQEYSGISTGFTSLDYATGGLVPTHLWVVDAFTSVGKTAYALNLAANVLRNGIPVLYFSLEQSIEELMMRLISIRSGVGGRKIRLDDLTFDERIDAGEAENHYSNTLLTFFDDIYSIDEIKAKVEEHARHQSGGIVILDYLQNLHWDDMFKTMSAAVTRAQLLAKRMGVTIIALSQISNSEAQQKTIGQYYSQKGSGAIRDAADKVIRLKRDRDSNELMAYLLKNRQGPSGSTFPLYFHLETGRITEVEKEPLNV